MAGSLAEQGGHSGCMSPMVWLMKFAEMSLFLDLKQGVQSISKLRSVELVRNRECGTSFLCNGSAVS